MNNETIQVCCIYVSSLVCEVVKKALAEKGIETSWNTLDSLWLFQVGENKIDIRSNDGKDKTIASIEGKLCQFVPRMAIAASIFAPGAYSTGYRMHYGFENEVKEYRQKLIVELLKM